MQNTLKVSRPSNFLLRSVMAIFALFITVVSMAQDTKKVDVNISTGSDSGAGFFASPWVWVVGIAVFILLLVALLRGGNRRGA